MHFRQASRCSEAHRKALEFCMWLVATVVARDPIHRERTLLKLAEPREILAAQKPRGWKDKIDDGDKAVGLMLLVVLGKAAEEIVESGIPTFVGISAVLRQPQARRLGHRYGNILRFYLGVANELG
jgi:hypothetical protein